MPTLARAETMSDALASAYTENPDLDQERAATRASDEAVAKAKSGERPSFRGRGAGGFEDTDAENGGALDRKSGVATPTSADLVARQTIFDGNKTTNQIDAATSRMFEARERLRQKEQDVLLASATAYMDVLRDTALVNLRHERILLLRMRLREARARLRVGENTPTDVAQVASYLATAHSDYFVAQGKLTASIGTYRRYIGHVPQRLEPARPLDALLPSTLEAASRAASVDHPQLQAALHHVDAVTADEKTAEAALYPEVALQGRLGQSNAENGNPRRNLFTGGGETRFDWDLSKGGATEAAIRQAKEEIDRARWRAEAARSSVLAGLQAAWGLSQSATELVRSARAAVNAAETAYFEVREEAKVGQRTVLDELKADAELEQSRETLIAAQHDRVVDTYALVAAIGQLSKDRLGLRGSSYDPTVHAKQVTDKWIGLRTPDGR